MNEINAEKINEIRRRMTCRSHGKLNLKHFYRSRSRWFHQTSEVVHHKDKPPILRYVAGTYWKPQL